jgi:hypothetical protein
VRERRVNSDDDQSLMNALTAYLAECPNAADTKLGVTEWWVMRQQVRVQVEAVGRALDRLVANGVLEEIGTGEQRLYRLRRG